MTQDEDDRRHDSELERYMAGRHSLSARYRQASGENTPPELDDAVLRRAAQAATGDSSTDSPAPAAARATATAPRRRRRWLLPVGLAASLLVGVDLAWRMTETTELGEPAIVALDETPPVLAPPTSRFSMTTPAPAPSAEAPIAEAPAPSFDAQPDARRDTQARREATQRQAPSAAAATARARDESERRAAESLNATPPAESAAAGAPVPLARAPAMAQAVPPPPPAASPAATRNRAQAQAAADELLALLRRGELAPLQRRYAWQPAAHAELAQAAAALATPVEAQLELQADGCWRLRYVDAQMRMRVEVLLRPQAGEGWRIEALQVRSADG